jgi:hypothetical protein
MKSDLKLLSSLNKIDIELDENLKQTTKSIEMVLNSPMFSKLYDLNRNLNSLAVEATTIGDTTTTTTTKSQQQSRHGHEFDTYDDDNEEENQNNNNNNNNDDDDTATPTEDDMNEEEEEEEEEEESDDSYAAKFKQSIRQVKVYLDEDSTVVANDPFLKQSNGGGAGLFRFLFLRNKTSNKLYVFLIKLNKRSVEDCFDAGFDKEHEFWFWWM